MAETVAKINQNRLMRHFTLRVKFVGVREHKVRMKIGIALIASAARIIGCGIEFDKQEPNDPTN